MRCLSKAALSVALSMLAPCVVFGQIDASKLTVTNYQLVSEVDQTRTVSQLIYRADLVNTGSAAPALSATVTSGVSSIQIVPGSGTLRFPATSPANPRVTSTNTFTVMVDRSGNTDFANLTFSFSSVAPVANAGPGQTVAVGSTVTLNGSGSTNPSGIGTLTYNWVLTSAPSGSRAALTGNTSVNPTFVADVFGSYVITLTVSNGAGSDTSSVTVSTLRSLPVANAGPNQSVRVGDTVTLSGSASSDVDGHPLTYSWTFVSRPSGSSAALTGANTVSPTFIVDKAGNYVLQLIVNDGTADSTPATITISTRNTPPVANAGPTQTSITLGSVVQLNGSGSTDVDGDPLTYRWSLITLPAGSSAVLNNPAIVNPTFTADVAGTYIAQLIVNDGTVDSSNTSTVTISTNPAQPLHPTANAGAGQTVVHGSLVTLNGSGSKDPQGLALTFQWTLITKPAGSNAVLSNPTTPNPIFTADLLGNYVAQLIVTNSLGLSSAPSMVTITTTNTPPVANAGPARTVATGSTVTLNGNGSTDADNDPLTFSWTFQSRPAGSTAVLVGANTAAPIFIADVAGAYVIQLIVNDGFASSSPATVMITAGTNPITLSPNPLNLQLNAPGNLTLTITIAPAAGSGGQPVNLTVFDGTIVAAPGTVTIPEGATSATVTITPLQLGSTNILASAPGFQNGTVTVNVGQPSIAVTLSSPSVGISRSVTGTLTLNSPAPSNGITVNLTPGGTGGLTLPTSVNIASGSTTGTFTVTGTAPAGQATITASSAGYTSGSVNISVVRLGQIALQQGVTVAPGQTMPFSVSLVSAAPTGGVTINLVSSDATRVTVTQSVFIAEGATTPATPAQVTGVNVGSATITGTAAGFDPDTQTVQVAANLVFAPTTLTIGTGATVNLVLTVTGAAPAGGVSVNLSSDNPGVASVPATVMIPANQSSVNVPVLGVSAGGPATITATSAIAGIASATAKVTVVLRVSIATTSLPNGTVQVPYNASVTANGGTAPLTFSATGLPAGLSISSTGQITGNPTSAGTSTAAIMVTDSSNPTQTGTANLSITISPALAITTTSLPGGTAQAPYSASVAATGGNTPYTFTATGLPAGLSISSGGQITGTPTSAGTSTAAITVTDSTNPTHATATSNLSITINAPLTITTTSLPNGQAGSSYSASVNAVGGTAPLTFTAIGLPAGLAISSGGQISGIPGAQGTSTAAITVTDSTNPTHLTVTANLSITIDPPVSTGPPILAVANVSVGQNLETPISFTIDQTPGPVTVSISSNNPNVLLVDARSPGAIGCTVQNGACAGFISLQLPAGTTGFTVLAQGLASSGQVAVTASASGYTSGTALVNLFPSGFVLAGPNGPGASFVSNQGVSTPLSVIAERFDNSGNPVQIQPVRAFFQIDSNGRPVLDQDGNPIPAGTVTVTLSSSNPGVGTVPAQVNFTGGTDTVNTQFTADSTVGSTVLTANEPAGFSVPANNTNTVPVSVQQTSIRPGNVTVGQGLETNTSFTLQGAPVNDQPFLITSGDPSRLLLSTNPTVAGSPSITVTIPAGRSGSPDFYVYGLSNSGTVGYTVCQQVDINTPQCASGAQFGSAGGTVTLSKSGFVLQSPFGFGANFNTTVQSGNSDITVFSALLDSSGSFVVSQALAGGTSASVNVISSNTNVGTITTSPVTITGGNNSATTQFHPVANGNTVIAASVPPGFTAPAQAGSVVATVSTPNITIDSGNTIGNRLEQQGTILLGAPAPSGGLPVTLTVTSGTIALSATATAAGSSSITVTIPAGQGIGTYFIQGQGISGTATVRATAPGFNTGNGTETLAPSGIVIGGPGGPGFPYNVSANSGAPVLVQTAILDPGTGNFVQTQPLAGGQSLTVPVSNSNTSAGTFPGTVTIAGGSDTGTANFAAGGSGQSTVLTLTTPAGFQSAPNNLTRLTINVQ